MSALKTAFIIATVRISQCIIYADVDSTCWSFMWVFLIADESVLECNSISPLLCYRRLLEQTRGLLHVASDVEHPSADLLYQFNSFMMPGSGRFDSHWKMCVLWSHCILMILLAAAWLAATAAFLAELATCESDMCLVLWRPTPSSGLPPDQGKIVVPSGRLLSWRISPTSSFTVLICARLSARQIMSLRWLWHCFLGALLQHVRPWRPSTN